MRITVNLESGSIDLDVGLDVYQTVKGLKQHKDPYLVIRYLAVVGLLPSEYKKIGSKKNSIHEHSRLKYADIARLIVEMLEEYPSANLEDIVVELGLPRYSAGIVVEVLIENGVIRAVDDSFFVVDSSKVNSIKTWSISNVERFNKNLIKVYQQISNWTSIEQVCDRLLISRKSAMNYLHRLWNDGLCERRKNGKKHEYKAIPSSCTDDLITQDTKWSA